MTIYQNIQGIPNKLESIFLHRSTWTHTEGGGGRDDCRHFQKHGNRTTQHPPTWGLLRETVRGWVPVNPAADESDSCGKPEDTSNTL